MSSGLRPLSPATVLIISAAGVLLGGWGLSVELSREGLLMGGAGEIIEQRTEDNDGRKMLMLKVRAGGEDRWLRAPLELSKSCAPGAAYQRGALSFTTACGEARAAELESALQLFIYLGMIAFGIALPLGRRRRKFR